MKVEIVFHSNGNKCLEEQKARNQCPKGWDIIEREVDPEDLFTTICKDILNQQKIFQEHLGRIEGFRPYELFSRFPSVVQLLSVPQAPEPMRSYVNEPGINIFFKIGFFASHNNARTWAVIVDKTDTSFQPIICCRFDGEKNLDFV